MNDSFGQKLRSERKNQDLTTQDLANKIGVSRSYITLIETGKRLPGKKNISKIALALGLKNSTVLNWYLEHLRKKLGG